jgi:PPK2 family polyphosphate:nucleotide phosphotransferase
MFTLSQISTLPPKKADKEQIKKETQSMKAELSELQNMLYAQNKYSALVIVQGMDASGKDGLIRNAFSTLNPTGIQVHSWKKPTEEEFAHDFLWRIHKAVPRRGMMNIFNRSHYEDILVPTVYQTHPAEIIEQRYRLINDFELLLRQNDTVVLKFYLHVSEKEQRERLAERETDPTKFWKYNLNDKQTLDNRHKFINCYETLFEHCKEYAPWHIVPADKNWYKEFIVVKTLRDTLKKLPLAYPPRG